MINSRTKNPRQSLLLWTELLVIISLFFFAELGNTCFATTFAKKMDPSHTFVDVGIFYGNLSPEWVRLRTETSFSIVTRAKKKAGMSGVTEQNIGAENGNGGGELGEYSFSSHVKDVLIREDEFYHLCLKSTDTTGAHIQSLIEDFNAKKLAGGGFFVYYDNGYKIAKGLYSSHEEALEAMSGEEMQKLATDNSLTLSVLSPDRASIVYSDGTALMLFFTLDEDWSITSDVIEMTCSSLKDGIWRKYRGGMRIYWADNSPISLINRVKIEDYLYGVVPNEMSYVWGEDALKAQAIAARNYVMSRMGSYEQYSLDVDDTTYDQVYRGYSSERPASTAAVDATAGEFLVFNDEIVPLYYHASSGGTLESSRDVWSADKGYLNRKVDMFSVDMPHENWTYSISSDFLAAAMNVQGYYVGNVHSMEILERTPGGRVKTMKINGSAGSIDMRGETFRKILGGTKIKSTLFSFDSNTASSAFGKNRSLIPTEYKPSRTTIHGTTTNTAHTANTNTPVHQEEWVKLSSLMTYTLSKNPPYIIWDPKEDSEFQTEVIQEQQINKTSGEWPLLEDAEDLLKYVDMPLDRADFVNGSIIIYGHGYGHGLGMSQVGAKKMADMGFDYKQILDFYYTGAVIENLYEDK